MSETLLPCPFCGGEAELCTWYGGGEHCETVYTVMCDNDNCPMDVKTFDFPTEAEAVAAWNTRSAGTCHSIDPVDSGEFFICSNCNFGAGRIEFIPNYCPSCGYKVVKNDDNR